MLELFEYHLILVELCNEKPNIRSALCSNTFLILNFNIKPLEKPNWENYLGKTIYQYIINNVLNVLNRVDQSNFY